jgi:branched-chain amino acid transport system ATP-binding protein
MLVGTIFNCLKTLKTRGATILLVEQNVHMALKIADRGYILETGRIVLSGIANELLTNEMVKKAYLGE